jgi:hypothetical protein
MPRKPFMSRSLESQRPTSEASLGEATGLAENSIGTRYRTIGRSFSPRHNSLNFIRLVLATTVAVERSVCSIRALVGLRFLWNQWLPHRGERCS